jgi:hypothetical protein
MKNTKQNIIIGIIIVILAILSGFYIYVKHHPASSGNILPSISTSTSTIGEASSTPSFSNSSTSPHTSVQGNGTPQVTVTFAPVVPVTLCGFTVTSPAPSARVTFPLTFSGTVDNSNPAKAGCTWKMSAGQAGTAQLYYNSNNSWHPIGNPVAITTKNAEAVSTTFSVAMSFNNGALKLPSETPMKVTFTEQHTSGVAAHAYDFIIALK